MNFLLLFVSVSFSFLFFVFYKLNNSDHFFWWELSSITGNLMIESLSFIALAFYLFFSFSNISFFRRKQKETKELQLSQKLFQDFNILSFLKEYIYYLGFIFFYSSIYLILKSFWITEFNYLILFLNCIIGILFFLTHKAELFRDFIKINTILFSLYYIWLYMFSFISWWDSLNGIDAINTLFIFSSFVITLYSDSKILKKSESDSPLILYFFLYSFIVFSFYWKRFLEWVHIDFIQIFIYVGAFFNIFIYFFLQKVHFFAHSQYLLRALSFLFIYISMFFWMIYLYSHIESLGFIGIIIIGILIYGMIFNYSVHLKYQNYVSFFFSVWSFIFLLYFILIKYFSFSSGNIFKAELVLSLTLSFFFVIISYMYSQKYLYDNYFLHFCAYLVNFLWIIYYFYNSDFRILDFGIILLLDSILIFLSYFKLKKLKK